LAAGECGPEGRGRVTAPANRPLRQPQADRHPAGNQQRAANGTVGDGEYRYK
jgi:hypothetical protein